MENGTYAQINYNPDNPDDVFVTEVKSPQPEPSPETEEQISKESEEESNVSSEPVEEPVMEEKPAEKEEPAFEEERPGDGGGGGSGQYAEHQARAAHPARKAGRLPEGKGHALRHAGHDRGLAGGQPASGGRAPFHPGRLCRGPAGVRKLAGCSAGGLPGA